MKTWTIGQVVIDFCFLPKLLNSLNRSVRKLLKNILFNEEIPEKFSEKKCEKSWNFVSPEI